MQKFSERKGYTQVSTLIQKEGMTDELRNSLWNILHREYWSKRGFIWRSNSRGDIDSFSELLQEFHFKKRVDELPRDGTRQLSDIEQHFFGCKWYEVYDFLSFFCSVYPRDEKLVNRINSVLKRELSAYRFVAGQVADITDEQEIEALKKLLRMIVSKV